MSSKPSHERLTKVCAQAEPSLNESCTSKLRVAPEFTSSGSSAARELPEAQPPRRVPSGFKDYLADRWSGASNAAGGSAPAPRRHLSISQRAGSSKWPETALRHSCATLWMSPLADAAVKLAAVRSVSLFESSEFLRNRMCLTKSRTLTRLRQLSSRRISKPAWHTRLALSSSSMTRFLSQSAPAILETRPEAACRCRCLSSRIQVVERRPMFNSIDHGCSFQSQRRLS